jgi:hypothetical protein
MEGVDGTTLALFGSIARNNNLLLAFALGAVVSDRDKAPISTTAELVARNGAHGNCQCAKQ